MAGDEPSGEARETKLRRLFRRHAMVYCAVNGALVLVNLVLGGGWWSFWPIFGWGMALLFHFFFVRTVCVEDGWAEERTSELRSKSYDLSHIEDIQDRYDGSKPHVGEESRSEDDPPDRKAG